MEDLIAGKISVIGRSGENLGTQFGEKTYAAEHAIQKKHASSGAPTKKGAGACTLLRLMIVSDYSAAVTTVRLVACRLAPLYQYRKPSRSTTSPTFRPSTAL